MNASSRAVVVVGSLHYDIVVDAPDRPRKGETVAGYGWRPKFGGKGGNQAAAAARAGAPVRMVGARLIGDPEVGAEEGGTEFRDELFHGVGGIAKAFAQLAVAALLGAGPMRQLVKEG